METNTKMSHIYSDLYLLAWQRAKQMSNSELLAFVLSKNAQVRDIVIREFHVRPQRDVFEIAKKLIQDTKAQQRSSGYLILAQLGTPQRPFRGETTPIILKGLREEKTHSVQNAIICAIGHLEIEAKYHTEIIEKFIQLTEINNLSLLISIAFAIGRLSRCGRFDFLVEKLKTKNNPEIDDWLDVSFECLGLKE